MPQIVQKLGKTNFEELCLPARRGKTSSTRGSRAGREHGDFNSNMNHAENSNSVNAVWGWGPADHPLFKFSRVTRENWS